MVGIVHRSLVQLVQLGFFHADPFVLGIAVAPLVQSSVAAEGSACTTSKDAYVQGQPIGRGRGAFALGPWC
jgi:hypothetical protein